MGLLKDGVTEHDFLEPLDGGSTLWGPDKGFLLLCEFRQWFGDIGETTNKWSLVAGDPKCATDLFDSGQLFQPGGQTITFRWINADSAVTDDYAQIIDRRSFEFTLRGLEEEALCFQEV
jgi:hypothetical protein